MKKLMTMAAIAALVLTSCSNDTEGISETDNPAKLISFRTVSDKTETYATPTDIGNMSNFTMNAFTDNATTTGAGFAFMTGLPVVKGVGTNGIWTYNPPKYWPTTTGSVHFFAYSPAASRNVSSITTTNGSTIAKINYIVPTSYTAGAATQEDFLVAAKSISTPVPDAQAALVIPFIHALSMASFKAENTSTNLTFIVEGIQLINLDNEGLLAITPTTTPAYDWSQNNDFASTYTASLPDAGVPLMPAAGLKLLTSDNEGLMILPQDLSTNGGSAIVDVSPADLGSNKSYVLVSYRTIDSYGTIRGGLKRWFPLKQTFDKSTKYVFQFSFSAGAKVAFTVTDIGPWNDSTPVTTPIN